MSYIALGELKEGLQTDLNEPRCIFPSLGFDHGVTSKLKPDNMNRRVQISEGCWIQDQMLEAKPSKQFFDETFGGCVGGNRAFH